MHDNLITTLAQKIGLKQEHIRNILRLLEEGATIPFIARYRKELTGGASDEVLREFDLLYQLTETLLQRKEEVSRLIAQRATLSESLKKSIAEADSLLVLEDIYRPFKEKKSTRASTAIKLGLTPLANTLKSAKLSKEAFKNEAKKFVKGGLGSVDEALQGAQDILAERYAENPREREVIRNSMLRFGVLETKKTKSFKKDGVYKNLAKVSQRVANIPSHKYLAIMRAVKEKELTVKIRVDKERIEKSIKHYKIPHDSASSKELLFKAYCDGLKRLLLPSIEREVHSELKEKADMMAINIFGKLCSKREVLSLGW